MSTQHSSIITIAKLFVNATERANQPTNDRSYTHRRKLLDIHVRSFRTFRTHTHSSTRYTHTHTHGLKRNTLQLQIEWPTRSERIIDVYIYLEKNIETQEVFDYHRRLKTKAKAKKFNLINKIKCECIKREPILVKKKSSDQTDSIATLNTISKH